MSLAAEISGARVTAEFLIAAAMVASVIMTDNNARQHARFGDLPNANDFGVDAASASKNRRAVKLLRVGARTMSRQRRADGSRFYSTTVA
jgi:hypothetical protein